MSILIDSKIMGFEVIMQLSYLNAVPFYLVYEGEGDAAAAGAGGTGAAGGTDAAAAAATGTDAPKTFTQEQVNSFLAEEKRKYQKTIDTQVSQLEQLKKSKGLTDKEKSELQQRIEDLNNSVLTKEQLAAKERDKLQNEHKTVVTTITGERDSWRNMFQTATITRAIQDEAVKADAFNPGQIVALLQSQTRLVEVTDAEGAPIPGEFVAKVKMVDTDKDGKPVTLDLTVAEALKRMKDRTDEYGNLFKSGVAGGVGGNNNRGTTGRDVDPSKLNPTEYRKWREAQGLAPKRPKS